MNNIYTACYILGGGLVSLGVGILIGGNSATNQLTGKLQALRAAGYKIRITIEATAPCAISGASAEGETVEEAVTRLGGKLENLKTERKER